MNNPASFHPYVCFPCSAYVENSQSKAQNPSFLTQLSVLTHHHCVCWWYLSMLVNTHGHINRFRAILVAHTDAVFSRIFQCDVVDGDGAACGLFSDGKMGLINNLPVVPKPHDLWVWLALDEARQTQSLRTG